MVQKNRFYKDPAVENKIDDLLSRMTLEEKLGQLTQEGTSIYDDHLDIKEDLIREGKIGSFLSIAGEEFLNKLQKIAVEESRLHIPLIFGHDVIHGYNTIFPIPLAQACAWDENVAETGSRVAADEASRDGIDWVFAPMVDIARDPRWGRIAEGFGEDTYLASKMAAASVRGFQGEKLSDSRSVAACAKHFAAYGGAVGGRDYNTVDMSLQMLSDVYLPPFEAACRAGAATYMSAFNDINGVPATANRYILRDQLKDGWGFDGFVVSDACAVAELIAHGYAQDGADAANKSITAGVDMDMGTDLFLNGLPQKVKSGELDIAVVDDAVRRVLRVKFALGLFEHPYRGQNEPGKPDTVGHRSAARVAACKSAVLLENKNGVLPLDKKTAKIAVVGPLANDSYNILGCWVIDAGAKKGVSLLEGIKAAVSEKTELVYAKGCGIDDADESGFDAALSVAREADVVIAAVGEDREMSGEMHCRSQLGLPGCQQRLLEILRGAGKPLVVVLMNGRPLALPWVRENADALIEAWHLGSESGNALADILFGDFNPSGRLAVTIPYSVGQVPFYYNHPNTGRPAREDILWSCKYLDIPIGPLYPFGYGLGYTEFQYSPVTVETPKVKIGEKAKFSAEITNSGKTEGVETVQLYIADVCASRVRPVRELKGYRKLSLQPGETRKVTFELDTASLGFYNNNMEYAVEPGAFKVWISHDSACGDESLFEVYE